MQGLSFILIVVGGLQVSSAVTECRQGDGVNAHGGRTGWGRTMTGDEQSGPDLDSLAHRIADVGQPSHEAQAAAPLPAGNWPGPRAVLPREREQAAAQLAAGLTGAVAQFLLDAEKQVLNRADRARASTLDDLERQRDNVQKLIGMFAERLRQQEELHASLQEEFESVLDRLNRHAAALRSLSETQAHQAALLGQILDVLRRLAATAGGPSSGLPGLGEP
jgi:hypothetical protein